jgi:phospholipase C
LQPDARAGPILPAPPFTARQKQRGLVMANGDPIEHVIVLALENRFFDHVLGDCQTVKPQIACIPPGAPPRTNELAKKL